jgi:hypothetical protein
MVPKGGLDRLSLVVLDIGLCGAASGWRAPKVALFLLLVGALAGSSPRRAPGEREKAPRFSERLRISIGAEGGTRTPTGFLTTPSSKTTAHIG